ncbi:MAG: N-6 DNA methylase, partial [candidate division Zixibacteria bacterium]|nr:N-6 DNA methylase [candidate division Zixibacteria bacterium]
SIPKIDKLLKNASKKGSGKGYPEFIISLKNNPDFIIVVECKANIAKHQSSTLDKYDEYAVDGALLYASFLSKEYDVLAIGVSGQKLKELRVSHYLYLKGQRKSVSFFGNKLLDMESYINGYLKSDEKRRQDYDALLDFSRELNEELHHHKIKEGDRALLISGILIALDNKAFCKAYKEYEKPEELAKFLVDTVSNVLRKANLLEKNLKNMDIQFSFIRTDTSLSTEQGVLRNFIDSIDENINAFKKTHEYYDVLGQLYIEFLRYANSDKGLGIVLTPPHITKLFCELAGVNKGSVVYDNCAGTGGFLISALNKMVRDAKGDLNKIKKIKEEQVIGVEYQAHIFALACSNMYIHQDGKANIINGDCFNNEVMEQVKKYKPTVGFLNPPYQVDKKRDTEELEFVLNNLEILQPSGICIAIVPMQCALAQKGKKYELKRRLLQKHTLEAVLSMPGELFSNSKTNVVSCIMIFTAHKPHPTNKETYFGYYKDDGFVKRKIKGRIETPKWESIKAEWVSSYINRKTKAGFSVNKVVTANDEWCAEAYMETDYEKLENSTFEETILNYASFLFQNKLSFEASKKSLNEKQIFLNINTWKWFEINSIFKLEKCKCYSATELLENGKDIYYIGAKKDDNGIMQRVEYVEELISKGNCIIFIGDGQGSVGYTTYQPIDFIGSTTLTCGYNYKLNKYNALFLITVLDLERFKYSFGRKYGKTQLLKTKIKLPSKDGQPDWDFMESYIKSLPYSSSI